ncbi:MAG: Pyrrolo-quinoline quinone [Gammaproteobacteria bacterium]|nr:Pyrrolo-quinoline quinone [Gammaproteobacteria bacterium]
MLSFIRIALRRPQTILGLALVLLMTDALLALFNATTGSTGPSHLQLERLPATETLLEAAQDNGNWIVPAKTYAGNRYTALTQIDKTNVGKLSMAWKTDIADDGQQEAAPIIWNGTLYVSTPHDGVLALDASNGMLRWQAPYSPQYVLLYAVNRGVGLADDKVFIATQDCRVIALDAATGKSLWNVLGCRDTSNSFYSMAAYVYKNQIILGTGGGDNGTLGLVSAFSTKDGKRLWDWQTIPGPGTAGHETWPGDSWRHGGGAVWSGLAIDQHTDTLFVAPGNPGPDMILKGREGENLYTDSLVALDISGPQPRIKWYYKILRNDSHDDDPAMIPVLFEGLVDGHRRALVAIGDKAGNFLILDRANGKVLHRLALSNQAGIDTQPSLDGTKACPNHGGGIEWNGGAYDPDSNSFLVPSTQECAVWKIATDDPQYIPGQPYTGGPLPKRQNGTGLLTSVDVDTGKMRWRHALPYPAEGGVLVTATGLAFTSDVGGNVYAYDAASGRQYWKDFTGSAVVAPISAYRLDGKEYLTVVVGEAGNQQTPNLPVSQGSRVIAYGLGSAPTVANAATGQVALASAPNGTRSESDAPPSKSTGSAPYTRQQVAQGQQVYAKECSVCHGANLQGLSAPALTGQSFGRSHLNAAQLRRIVTQSMPLAAPGSLPAADYAAVMAFLLSYDCVPPAGGTLQPFPTTDLPSLQQVNLGGVSCAPKPSP